MKLFVACLLVIFSAAVSAGNLSLVIVSGIGGTAEYSERFTELASRLQAVAIESGLAETQIYRLTADADNDDHLPASRQQLADTLTAIADGAAENDELLLVLIGHGTPRERSALFNLPGPDIDPFDLADLLERFGDRRVAVVNTASASGPFLRPLSGNNRVIITATSSGQELHATEFPQHFVSAFEERRADRNKDSRVSLLEAFNYARLEVRRSYESDERLLTEHALLDDNADGEGSLEADEFSADGALAAAIYLQQPEQVSNDATAELLAMLERKQLLEEEILGLKRRKQFMQSAEYYQQLELLLIDLARLVQRIQNEATT